MSDSVRPHRRQLTRLPRPWNSPGKDTGVGCHFLLQCMKAKSESEVTQSCPTLSDPMDCSLPGSSIYGFLRQEYWSGVPLPSLRTHHGPTQMPSVWKDGKPSQRRQERAGGAIQGQRESAHTSQVIREGSVETAVAPEISIIKGVVVERSLNTKLS